MGAGDGRLRGDDALSQCVRPRHAARHALCGSRVDLHLGAAAGEAPRVFEDGRQRRDFVHVRDVAAATVLACERSQAGVRAYNVGSGTPRTVGDMALALARALDGPRPAVTGQYRLGDVRHITADSSRLRRELGWSPAVDFADGMAELAALSVAEPARPRVALG
ncbi:NAD-dependent epimerase/dehydratase family protein [Ancylobacter dichloromethanicus]